MQESIVNKSSRRRIARRLGAAVMALAAVLTLGACKATGGGYIDEPLPGGPDVVFQGRANFGFNFTCQVETAKKRAVIKGSDHLPRRSQHHRTDGRQDPRYGGPLLPGVASPHAMRGTFLPASRASTPPGSRASTGRRTRRFPRRRIGAGSRSTCSTTASRAVQKTSQFTRLFDDESLHLDGGVYAVYTRAGYIEGGNIQVDNT